MTKTSKIYKYLPFLLLLFAIGFNFWTLLPELSVKIDPNDNVFQYVLVQRMNEVWEKGGSLIDHWVPQWASGYPLPFYYQHLPHLLAVTVYHLLLKTISLYGVFNLIKFLLWVFFPLSLYLSGRKFGFSKLTSSLSAFFGSQILTDGLYGADISSFAWRGYGISTQLFALFFAPLALAQIYQVVKSSCLPAGREKLNPKSFALAVLLLAASFASHMAIGYLVALSALFIPLSLAEFSIKKLIKSYLHLFFLLAACFLLLSYWFIPLLMGNTYHNVSFWDAPLKWNSYGYKEVITMFLNGQLFDFGRRPVLTFLLVIGFFVCLYRFKGKYRLLALLFPFWILLYFGRTTWGFLIDLLPMMKEMHLQRLINSLHLVSFPLIGIGASFLFKRAQKTKLAFLPLALIILLAFPVYKANYSYLFLNKVWIKDSNRGYQEGMADFQKLVEKILSLPPGRVYAGTPGGWGREFKIGSTQVYLALSNAGLSTIGFLPESWSLNSDPEPFFNQEKLEDYNLFNVRYLVVPKDYQLPKFARETARFSQYKLAQVPTSGFFDLGTSNLVVKTNKTNILNIIHLWQNSDLPGKKEYPTLSLTKEKPLLSYPTQIKLENNFFPSPLIYPLNKRPASLGKVLEEKLQNESYKSKIEVDQNCQDCLVIFKMTYHPNWQVKIDGRGAEKLMVFPSYMAAKIEPGKHEVVFEYQSSRIKLPLLFMGIASLFVILEVLKKKRG